MKTDFLNSIPYLCDRWTTLAAENPSAAFLVEEVSGKSYTRGQVEELSARVYAWLVRNGIGSEDFVLIRLPRDARPFIAMLGVWKAGAAFTATEDNYAPERIGIIREYCGCRLVLDEDAWMQILETAPMSGFRRAADHDACFAIYTSGSTGKPKGVLQEYGKIKLNQASLEAHPGDLIHEGTCMPMLAPLNFIAAVKIWLNALYSGMRLVVFSMETARNPAWLNRQFIRYGVNLAFLSPSILRVMTDGVATSLKTLVTGSESANGIYFPGVRLINNYGMSEAGFHVAQFVIDRRYDMTPIGKPVFGDIRILLLDEDGKEVPDGEKGEICFDNPFFRGYIRQPEETAKVLRGGIFHSGDLGKRLPDGNIIVTGRLNTMVKINGNRVEPGEIEACIRKIPGIGDAAVKDFTNDRQQVFLCAFYTSEESIQEETIRQALQQSLPHYMIPAFFTHLSAMPLNRNGKVDRSALPRPDAGARVRAYEPPSTPAEKAICDAYEKVLQVNRIGAADDFFALGGDSLSAALVAAELETIGVDYKDIYAWKTPKAIAARLPEKNVHDLDTLNQAALLRDQPLTPYQTYFYDAQLYSPMQTMMNNPISLKFPKTTVDPVRLKGALEAVFSRYAIFSTVLSHSEDGDPVLRYIPGRIIHPEIRSVCEYPDTALADLIQPYRLKDELMYRCRILVTETHVFLNLDTNHLITDGTAMANFMDELFRAYRGEPLRQDHYYLYLEDQSRRRAELERNADALLLMKRFSRSDYLCNPPPDLVSRRTGNGRFLSRTVPTLEECLNGCKKLHTSLNKIFVAASLTALSRFSKDGKVSVEWTYHGRDENWKKDLVGLTISSVPVSADMSQIHTPQELIDEIDRQNELGMRYADLSLGNNGVTPGERDRMIVVYETGFDMGEFLPEGTEVSYAYDQLNGVFTRFQLILFNSRNPDQPIPFYFNYDSELYSPQLVERFCCFFNDALVTIVSGGQL